MVHTPLSEAAVSGVAVTTEPLLSPTTLAGQLGIPIKTLAEWRSRGVGPKYMKLGRHARYRQQDVDEWLALQEHRTG